MFIPERDDAYIRRTLNWMESLREDIAEAETPAKARQLKKQYDDAWRAVEPLLKAKDAQR